MLINQELILTEEGKSEVEHFNRAVDREIDVSQVNSSFNSIEETKSLGDDNGNFLNNVDVLTSLMSNFKLAEEGFLPSQGVSTSNECQVCFVDYSSIAGGNCIILKVATCLNCGIKAHPVCVGLTKHQYTIDDLYTPDVFFTCEKCLDAKQNHHTKDQADKKFTCGFCKHNDGVVIKVPSIKFAHPICCMYENFDGAIADPLKLDLEFKEQFKEETDVCTICKKEEASLKFFDQNDQRQFVHAFCAIKKYKELIVFGQTSIFVSVNMVETQNNLVNLERLIKLMSKHIIDEKDFIDYPPKTQSLVPEMLLECALAQKVDTLLGEKSNQDWMTEEVAQGIFRLYERVHNHSSLAFTYLQKVSKRYHKSKDFVSLIDFNVDHKKENLVFLINRDFRSILKFKIINIKTKMFLTQVDTISRSSLVDKHVEHQLKMLAQKEQMKEDEKMIHDLEEKLSIEDMIAQFLQENQDLDQEKKEDLDGQKDEDLLEQDMIDFLS